ncbi:hypothetical protein Bca52824_065814 [Brassica carinata]|uniref:Uncharacterized protein n=1 Tax=Brassica carinata TaxID=52824 RepID=A0A8X7UAD0_BRACI|nr:hypothetical protein Bca52824_065814 [Brassica carinata]
MRGMWGNQEEQRRMHVQYTPSSYKVQATSPQQMTYPRMGGSGTHNMMQNLPRIATGEVHSSFQSPHGLTSPPRYTSTAAVTLLSLALSLSMSGYPSHEATVPMPYDISSPSSGYNNSFSRGSFSPTAQNTPLVDPFQVQYYQQAQAEAYAPSNMYLRAATFLEASELLCLHMDNG